jgi:tetratricopeptide (TPR) repeat protein
MEMLRLRNFDAAFHYFDTLIDLEPHNALAHAMRGRCYLEMGRLENALIDAAKAISLDNTYYHPYLTKGRALYQMGMLHEAVLEFEKAVWYNRKDAEGYRWRGLVHCRLGYHVHGETDLKKAVELGDENAQYLLRRRDDVKIWGNQKL